MPYAGQGYSNYAAGDNYGGGYNYAAGGFFGDIGKFIGGVAKRALPFVPLIGQPLSQALQLTASPPQLFPGLPPIRQLGPGTNGGGGYPAVGTMQQSQALARLTMDPTLGAGCTTKGYHLNKAAYWRPIAPGAPSAVRIEKGSVCVRNRRINIANPKALRKAVRRAQGFAKMARRVMTFVDARAPKGRARFKKR